MNLGLSLTAHVELITVFTPKLFSLFGVAERSHFASSLSCSPQGSRLIALYLPEL